MAVKLTIHSGLHVPDLIRRKENLAHLGRFFAALLSHFGATSVDEGPRGERGFWGAINATNCLERYILEAQMKLDDIIERPRF